MRKHFSRCIPDVETLCVMKRYYSQMLMVKKRFPLESNDVISIQFSWVERLMDISNPLSYDDINFELCCVMFNIGAIHSLIAIDENRANVDSIKNAFTHFQCAAWSMQTLRDELGSDKYAVADFETSILTFYLNILLAQAQECLFEKSIIDHRSNIAIAKLTEFLSVLYGQCSELIENSLSSELISASRIKEMARFCCAKSELYGAISSYYLGCQAAEDTKMGLRLAHFSLALDQINHSLKNIGKERNERFSLKKAAEYVHGLIKDAELKARQENDFIYHELVPAPKNIPKIEGIKLSKPVGFNPCDPSVIGDDLFNSLLPTDVIKTISLYSEEKSKLKRGILAKVDRRDQELEEYLISMRIDQLNLYRESDHIRLPDELLECCAAFTSQPDAYPDLLDNLQKIALQSAEVDQKLIALSNKLLSIDNADLINDQGYKTAKIRLEELVKHQNTARENNNGLQRALASYSESLKLLSLPLPQLTKYICGETLNPIESVEGRELRSMLDKVDEMRSQRRLLVKDFECDLESDDISKKALSERDMDRQNFFHVELGKHDRNLELINLNLQAQDAILKRLTEVNANFAEYRQKIIETAERKKENSLLIITAYKALTGIISDALKALDFYKQLSQRINPLEKVIRFIDETNLHLNADIRRKQEEEKTAANQREQRRLAELDAAQTLREFNFINR